MSIKLLNEAFLCPLKPSSLKFVLVAICDYASDKREAYPCVKSICEKTCLDRKTVLNNLKKLCELGILKDTKKRTGSTNQVKVFTILTIPKTEQFQKRNHPENTLKEYQKRDMKQSQKRDTEPPVEPLEPPIKEVKKKWSVPDWINISAWDEFEEFRTKYKKTGWSDLARTKAVNLLKDYSHEEQQAAIDKSILGGYAGLFPKKLNGYDNETNRHTSKPKSKHEQFWDRTKARLASPT